MTAGHRSIASTWGSTPAERLAYFPCDRYLPRADGAYFRAVDVLAPTAVVFRWLCQLKVAPYSYDWLDNGGRRSPRELTPGLEQLARGQRVMGIFELVEFAPDRHLTLVLASPRARAIYGDIAVSYVARPETERSCRLVAKLLVRYPARGPWSGMRRLLPWGDLLMMRKQLLTLKQLAERQVR
jgi:hypothetical protein